MVDPRKPTDAELAWIARLTAREMLSAGWQIRSCYYHPVSGDYHPSAWVNVELGLGPVETTPAQYRWLVTERIPGMRHWDGEHENNGPSWTGPGPYADEDDAWSFSTREIYEFIDPELPYKDRFRTLRYELVIHHDGKRLGVIPLSSERWYALASMALNEGRTAAAAGL